MAARRTVLRPFLIAWAVVCALAFVLPSTASAQREKGYPGIGSPGNQSPTNVPPQHPATDTTDLNRFFVMDVSWKTPTHLVLKLRARERIGGVLYEYVYRNSGEWYERWPVDVSNKFPCSTTFEHCWMWMEEEEHEFSFDVPPGTRTVKFVFRKALGLGG